MGVRPDPGAPGTAHVQLEALLPLSSPIAAPKPSSSPAPLPGPQPLSPTSRAPREHRLTALLRETLATASCRTTMIAHVSDAPARHAETLSTMQLAARVHRLRRKKVKVGFASWAPSCMAVVLAPLLPRRRPGPRPWSPPGEPERLTVGAVVAWSLSTQPRGGVWPGQPTGPLWPVPSQAWSCRARPGALTGSGKWSWGALGPGALGLNPGFAADVLCAEGVSSPPCNSACRFLGCC